MSNVAAFPAQDGPNVLTFADGYLTNLAYGDGWRRLANTLPQYGDLITPAMQQFVHDMRRRTKRPSNKQIALLVGLLVNAKIQIFLAECDARDEAEREHPEPKRTKRSNVVALKGRQFK